MDKSRAAPVGGREELRAARLNTSSRGILYPRHGAPLNRRTAQRNWRRRAHRGQVSAIATLLGLLLIVTFIANYLTTQLPVQMQVNDLNHDIEIENQLARFGALLQTASDNLATGAQLTQPVSLGSVGVPPFAGPDSAYTSGTLNLTSTRINYTTYTPSTYDPPTGWVAGGYLPPGHGCVATATALSCTSTPTLPPHWNFTGNTHSFYVNLTTGGVAMYLNFSTNGSSVYVNTAGGATAFVQVVGNSNTVALASSGAFTLNATIVGSSDHVTVTAASGGNIGVLRVVGNSDKVTTTTAGGSTFLILVYGTLDALVYSASSAGSTYRSYFVGFNATAPTSSLCPYGNLSSTDKVTSFSSTGGNTLTLTLNNSVHYYANNTNGTGWTNHFQNVALTACPYFTPSNFAGISYLPLGAGFIAHLQNTFAPQAQVAYAQGGVVYAQLGGTPIFIENPSVTVTATGGNVTALRIWIPEFVNPLPSVSGTGTVSLVARLLAVNQVVVSAATHLTFAAGSSVVFSIASQFAVAWLGYFTAQHWPGVTITCSPVGSVACLGPYALTGGIGQVVLTVPTTALASLSVTTALFSLSLQ